jgi:hypothetical protein
MSNNEFQATTFRPITNRKIPVKTLASLDTEDDSQGNLISICFYNGKDYKIFYNRYDFIQFIFDYKFYGKLFIACCNVEYDIINCFRDYWSEIELFYGNRLIFAKLKGRHVYFIDTLNHYKMSVQAQGEYIGKPKLKFNPEDIAYVKRDTEIVYDFVVEYQKRLNKIGCEMKYTIASTALNLFRRNYLHDIIKKIPDETLDILKQAYYGGRTEIFNKKAEGDKDNPIYYWDINSLYPYVMKNNIYPVPDSFFEDKKKELREMGIIYCDVEYINNDYLPYLPVRYNGKLMFPLGKLSGYWSLYEINYAVKHKIIRINKVHKVIAYSESGDYFSNYVNDLYTMRQAVGKSDTFMNLSLKLLMNSLYGKFGEKVESKRVIEKDGFLVDVEIENEYYPVHTNYILSLYTTAYARTVLYENCKKVLDKSGKLLYIDTDSILAQGDNIENVLTQGKELGQFKLEGLFKKAEFFLPKAYRLTNLKGEECIKVKGVPSDMGMSFLNDGVATFLKPVRLRESIRRIDKEGFKANKWVSHTKVLKSIYDKRHVLPDGSTRPLEFVMW